MQFQKCGFDIGINPSFISIRCSLGTGCDHFCKGHVAGDAKNIVANRFGQRPRKAEMIQRQDRALFRFDPIGVVIVARVRHRENPLGIGAQQQVDVDGHAASDMFAIKPNCNCTIWGVGL